jgi:cation-transporting ATPase 13A3/4/5
MITGDNAPCGCFVAKQAGLSEPNAPIVLGSLTRSNSVEWNSVSFDDAPTEVVDIETLQPGVELAVTGDAFDLLRKTGTCLEIRNQILVLQSFPLAMHDVISCCSLFSIGSYFL